MSISSSLQWPVRRSVLSVAIAGVLASALGSTSAFAAPVAVKGVVAGSYFTAPINSDNPALSQASTTVSSTYQGAKVCFDLNNNGVCDNGEPSTTTKADGSFLLSSLTAAPLVAEVSTSATNNGQPIAQRTVFRAAARSVYERHEQRSTHCTAHGVSCCR